MVKKCGEKLTSLLLQKHIISETEKNIYLYGFDIYISTFLTLLSLLIISIAIKRVISFLCFFSTFFVLRIFCGGYHAKTYSRCFFISHILFLLILALTEIILIIDIYFVVPIFVILSGIIIFLLAPIKNKKHPLSEQMLNRNQFISRILCVVETLILLIGFISPTIPREIIFSSFSYTAVAVMMLIAIIPIKKGGEKNEKGIIKSCWSN